MITAPAACAKHGKQPQSTQRTQSEIFSASHTIPAIAFPIIASTPVQRRSRWPPTAQSTESNRRARRARKPLFSLRSRRSLRLLFRGSSPRPPLDANPPTMRADRAAAATRIGRLAHVLAPGHEVEVDVRPPAPL